MMEGAAEEGREMGVSGEGKGFDMVTSVCGGGSSDLGTRSGALDTGAEAAHTECLRRRYCGQTCRNTSASPPSRPREPPSSSCPSRLPKRFESSQEAERTLLCLPPSLSTPRIDCGRRRRSTVLRARRLRRGSARLERRWDRTGRKQQLQLLLGEPRRRVAGGEAEIVSMEASREASSNARSIA